MGNNENSDKERNQHLSNISKSVAAMANNKNEKRALISMIISIIAIAISIIVPFIEHNLDKVNKPLLFDKNNITIESDDKSDNYNVSFKIKQGGIKKAYFVLKVGSEISYENIIENIENKSLQLNIESKSKEIDMKNEKASIKLNNVTESAFFDNKIKERRIDDFSLVILDTTGQWWIYYFVTSPEFIPQNIKYKFEVKNDDGEIVASSQENLDEQEMDYVMIDGTLTSELSIEKSLQNLETDYKLFSERRKIKGENGEIFESQPKIENIYTPPKSEDVYNDIITIRDDINTISLNQ